jgi:hypothetical protein
MWLKEFDIDVVKYARSYPNSIAGARSFLKPSENPPGTGFSLATARMHHP